MAKHLDNFGRKCEVSQRRWEFSQMKREKVAVDTKEEGVFHQWANQITYRMNPPREQTVGIVELQTGQVVTILPGYIRFTEGFKSHE